MTISGRLTMLVKAKASKALDRAEDPQKMLNSYQKQLELLQQVRLGVAAVATSRERLELQAEQLASLADKLEQQAVSTGRENLAREALARRFATLEQLADLGPKHASLQAQETKLALSEQRLQAKVEAFRTRKETIKATYTAAEAETKIGEACAGISEEMADVGLTLQRAEDKTARSRAQAGRIDELLVSGTVEDTSVPGQDPIQSELNWISAHSDVVLEMTRLKAALPARGAPAAILAVEQDADASPLPRPQLASGHAMSAEDLR